MCQSPFMIWIKYRLQVRVDWNIITVVTIQLTCQDAMKSSMPTDSWLIASNTFNFAIVHDFVTKLIRILVMDIDITCWLVLIYLFSPKIFISNVGGFIGFAHNTLIQVNISAHDLPTATDWYWWFIQM